MSSKAKDTWGGPNYTKSYVESRRLADKIKEFYRHSKVYDSIEVRVVFNKRTEDYYIRSNIGSLMPNVANLEESVGL